MNAPATAGDTIFALSSGNPPAAIAVLRISGPAAGPTLLTLSGRLPPPRVATLARLTDEAGNLLDRALLLWFPGPTTATGEDLAELHLHGGRATIAAMLAWLAKKDGLRAAAPGEFTRRALQNGRIDLAQAEGLGDLLAAETEMQRRAAARIAEGGVGAMADRLRTALLGLSAQVEADLDFAEDQDLETPPLDAVRRACAALLQEVRAMLRNPPAERLRDGVRVVVAGPVNVGKSTLVNALAGREVAIATPIAGTTRDLIEVPVAFDGVPCVLIDSAGLRATDDAVERIGVARAEQAIAGADVVFWLGPPDTPPDHPCVVTIHAQADRLAPPQARCAQLRVSALTGAGLVELRKVLVERATAILPDPSSLTLNARQRSVLEDVASSLGQIDREIDALVIAEELRAARSAVERLTGHTGVEDVLETIFSRFCVGK